jgi:hypothetical protein
MFLLELETDVSVMVLWGNGIIITNFGVRISMCSLQEEHDFDLK